MPNECCNCHDPLGPEAGELPFRVTEALDGKKSETWCPQCFVHHRAPLEPERFYPGAFAAVRCGRCGVTAVDCGMGCCPQCGFRGALALPPKPHALNVPRPAGVSTPLDS